MSQKYREGTDLTGAVFEAPTADQCATASDAHESLSLPRSPASMRFYTSHLMEPLGPDLAATTEREVRSVNIPNVVSESQFRQQFNQSNQFAALPGRLVRVNHPSRALSGQSEQLANSIISQSGHHPVAKIGHSTS